MRSKTRDLTSFSTQRQTITELWVRRSDGVVLNNSSTHTEVPGVVKREASTIIDDHGPVHDQLGLPITRPCVHTSTRYELDGTNAVVFKRFIFGQDRTRTLSGMPGHVAADLGGMPPSLLPSFGTVGIPAPIDWAALNESFDEACEQFLPTGLLIGEDVAEHGIFVDAVKLMLNPSRGVKTLVERVAPLLKGLLRPTLKDAHDIAKNAGNSFLSYNFGVKPAIQDVKHVLDAQSRVSQRLAFLRKNKGSFIPIRVRQVKTEPNTSGTNTTTFSHVYSTYAGDSSNVGTASAYGRIRNDLNHRDSWVAYAQYFGVQHVVGLAWELIPFSFVVDWVTNAQERIRNLTRLRLGGPFSEYRNFCFSEKSLQEFHVMISPGLHPSIDGFSSDFSSPIKLGSGVVSQYKRSLTSPEDTVVFNFKDLGIFHILASGSLLLQKT